MSAMAIFHQLTVLPGTDGEVSEESKIPLDEEACNALVVINIGFQP